MLTVNKYDSLSKYNIDRNELIRDFTENLDEKMERIKNFKYNKSTIYKITHPIKMIRNNIEYNRLTDVKKKFKDAYNSSIMLFVEEETGNLEDDLEYASRVVKPKFMENYVKQLYLKK